MKWEKGRQEATKSVQKLLLLSGKTWDCYLLKLPSGSEVEPHFDKVEGKEHHRINITLWGFWKVFIQNHPIYKKNLWQFPFKMHKFRPDIQEHSAKIYKNTLLISIGWVK